VPVYFDEFFYVLDPDPGKVDPDIGRRCLNVRQVLAE
jgi:hypothetical protein